MGVAIGVGMGVGVGVGVGIGVVIIAIPRIGSGRIILGIGLWALRISLWSQSEWCTGGCGGVITI